MKHKQYSIYVIDVEKQSQTAKTEYFSSEKIARKKVAELKTKFTGAWKKSDYKQKETGRPEIVHKRETWSNGTLKIYLWISNASYYLGEDA